MKQLNNCIEVLKSELKLMIQDKGVILIMLGAIFIYTTFYSVAYQNQTLTSMPIGVIDNSNTTTSREFIRAVDISPNVEVTYEPTNFEEAKKLFYERKIHGVILIPSNYEECIMSGKQVKVSIYADASYFLMYKQMFLAFTSAMMSKNVEIEVQRFVATGQSEIAANSLAEPVTLETDILFNPEQGYATFVMPAIMILILQQTILLGIGIIGGTQREQKLYTNFKTPSGERYSTMSILLGKIFAYFFFAMLISFCVFGAYYKILGYPVRSGDLESLIFFVPYILSSITMGIAISTLFKYRETAIIVLVAWSLPFLLMSGVSFPKEGIPEVLNDISLILPSSSAINGFNRYHIMGAPLSSISFELNTMTILTIVYFIISFFALKIRLNTEFKKNS